MCDKKLPETDKQLLFNAIEGLDCDRSMKRRLFKMGRAMFKHTNYWENIERKKEKENDKDKK